MALALLPPPARSGATTDVLSTIAAGLARSVTGTELPMLPGQQRAYAHLLATQQYEAWLIAWAPAGGLELHDHGGSHGAVHVAQGRLTEAYVDPESGGAVRTRVLTAGAGIEVPAPRVHEVWNPGPGPALVARLFAAAHLDDLLRLGRQRRLGAVAHP